MFVFDASSKIPSGLLAGNMFELGMYDECLVAKGISEGVEIRGRHCMYTITVTLGEGESLPFSPSISICIPDSCNGDDVISLFESFTSTNSNQLLGFGLKVTSATCLSIDQQVWDTEFIVCLFVHLTFFLGWLTAADAFAFCLFGTRSLMEPNYKYNIVYESFFTTPMNIDLQALRVQCDIPVKSLGLSESRRPALQPLKTDVTGQYQVFYLANFSYHLAEYLTLFTWYT
ncbi:hypothetical protein TSAR_008168 [Trichomalopsis sarcophagae]|uniref:Nose resistant-to-fluoxetine protein N-terminal domain-containing protein n=1 Tax=Trichomalopsis sarcophagae TaxID=543379 RepID=A0A232EIR7_9HYME|nr:hypothetical protein TSAR_008168 [Trichomalopsis sarcophagae]